MTGRQAALATWAALAALLLAGCFDQPISEGLEIVFLDGGEVELAARVDIRPVENGSSNPALERRLDERRRGLLGGWDPWVERFERVEAASERTVWEKDEGVLVSWQHRARLADASQLTDFFAAAGVGAFVSERGDRIELGLYADAGQQATRRQRKRVARATADWSEALAAYLDAAAALFEHLDERPGRAAACLGHLFSELVEADDLEALGELQPGERELVAALESAMEPGWEVLLVGDGDAYSLEELSRQIYDPFPAALTVVPPETPLEVEGFEETGDGRFVVPRVGLWRALEELERDWIEPALLTLWVEASREEETIDPWALAGRPRRVEPASSGEILDALIERLAPAPAYRLVWPAPTAAAGASSSGSSPTPWPDAQASSSRRARSA